MNAIDIHRDQTLSALITNESKDLIVKEITEEMTLEDYYKLLDEYEAKYPISANSDNET